MLSNSITTNKYGNVVVNVEISGMFIVTLEIRTREQSTTTTPITPDRLLLLDTMTFQEYFAKLVGINDLLKLMNNLGGLLV